VARLGAVPPGSLLASLAWSALAFVCFAARWRLLLRAWGAAPPRPLAALATVLRSSFWNLLPGGLVGDLARSDAARHTVGGLGNALAALWFERLGGLAGLFAVALAARAFAPRLPDWFTRLTVAGLAASLVLLGLSLAATRSAALARRLAALPLVGARLGALTPPSRPRDLTAALLLSLATQGSSIAALAVVVRALAPAASPRAVLAVSPAAVLLTFVPLTPAGVGQREAVFSMVYAQAGVEAAVAVAASLSTFSVGLLFPLVGGALALNEYLRVATRDEG
ncbi:MAG: hypothetical protein JWM10_1510, partial [Myxococcaceae bacterium]|nr:hypothetical protein [Myxococcaceae bacterium]